VINLQPNIKIIKLSTVYLLFTTILTFMDNQDLFVVQDGFSMPT